MEKKRQILNNGFFLLAVIFMISFASCAHKTGHKKDKFAQANSMNAPSSQQTPIAPSQPADVSVPYGKHKDKMDGPEIFKKYSSAVFMVFTSDGSRLYQGSGFFINDNGLAVSNYHVFKSTYVGQESIKLAGSDSFYKLSEVIQKDENNDFILFKVNCTNTNYIPLASSKPNVGEKVFAIGSPRGLENTFSSGEVSQWRDANLMQISALIDHGSSGGALINEYGEVVGITSGTFYDGSQANLNYAV